jgi:hypothetical protein
VAEVIECLSSKHEALSSNASTAKKRTKQNIATYTSFTIASMAAFYRKSLLITSQVVLAPVEKGDLNIYLW